MYIQNLKSLSLCIVELYSGSKNLKVNHATQAAYYFMFTVILCYLPVLLVINLCTKFETSSHSHCVDRGSPNVTIGHVTWGIFPFDIILKIFG